MRSSVGRRRAVRIRLGRVAMVGVFAVAILAPVSASAVASLGSIGTSHVEDFDALAGSGTGNAWVDDVTLLGWYATATTYRASAGTDTTGSLFSFGTGTDRALGSLRSNTVGDGAFGLRLRNDTGIPVTSLGISYTGEQWRNGGNTTSQRLEFAYRSGAEVADLVSGSWTDVDALDFVGPVATSTASALDGNAPASRVELQAELAIALEPGEEIMLRFTDVNDAGSDHGLAVDDLTVTAFGIPPDTTPPELHLPGDIATEATGPEGTPVSFEASALDDVDGQVTTSCDPPSGSTFPPGTTVVTCEALDSSGNVTHASFTVSVTFAFSGFFRPIDLPGSGPTPVVNVMKAGAAVPVRFGLGGDLGMDVIRRMTRDQVPCGSSTTFDGVEETVSAGGSGLSYDPATELYTYVWKTEKAWSSSPSPCRLFDLELVDGTHHVAYFAFTR